MNCFITNKKLQERNDFLKDILKAVKLASDPDFVLIHNLEENIKYLVEDSDYFIFCKERSKKMYKHSFNKEKIKDLKLFVSKENKKGKHPKIGFTFF